MTVCFQCKSSGGVVNHCCDCERWICNECSIDKIKRLAPCQCTKIVLEHNAGFCQDCTDKRELKLNPRPNFQPDAPVVPEECYVYQARKKPKPTTQTTIFLPTTPLSGDHKMNEGLVQLTLLQLATQEWPKFDVTVLAKKFPQVDDDNIYLDESNNKHDYYVRFNPNGDFEKDNIQSTSDMVKGYFPVYNKYEALGKMLSGQKWGPKSEDYGSFFTTDEAALVPNLKKILWKWQTNNLEKVAIGKFVHYLIEADMNGSLDLFTNSLFQHLPRVRMYLLWKTEEFLDKYDAFRTELRLFHRQLRLTGTWDFVCVKKGHGTPAETGGILYVNMKDWKNAVVQTESNFPDVGLDICSDVKDIDGARYSMQQCNYEAMAKNKDVYPSWNYNGHTYSEIRFESKTLVCFDDSNRNGRAKTVSIVDFGEKIAQMWAARKKQVDLWEAQHRPPIFKHTIPKLSDEQEDVVLKDLIRNAYVFVEVTSDCEHRLATPKSKIMLLRTPLVDSKLRLNYLHKRLNSVEKPIVVSAEQFGEFGRETREVWLMLQDLTKLGIAPETYCTCHYYNVLFDTYTEAWNEPIPPRAKVLKVHIDGQDCLA